jgi:hypothetical protein
LDEGQSDLLDADVAAIDGSFGVLDDAFSIGRSDGARAAHLERLAAR